MIKKILATLGILTSLLFLTGLGFVWYVGAWNVLFPSKHHDEVSPQLPVSIAQPSILIFSKTNSFRHKDGIAAGSQAIHNIAERRGWGVFHTENGAVFNTEQLKRFAAIVFLNTTGNTLNTEQRSAMKSWLEIGGGWFGIHSAGDGSHGHWPWYQEKLIGTVFTAHIMGPQFQYADVIVENPEHPVVANLAASFSHLEEWYSWDISPRQRGFTVLARVDEHSYTPYQRLLGRERDLRMGDHPVVWANCVGQGRTVYSALGHAAEAYAAPEHLLLIENALSWTLGLTLGLRGSCNNEF